jgi:hypothetical protein
MRVLLDKPVTCAVRIGQSRSFPPSIQILMTGDSAGSEYGLWCSSIDVEMRHNADISPASSRRLHPRAHRPTEDRTDERRAERSGRDGTSSSHLCLPCAEREIT